MNNAQQAKNGFKTFVITFVISVFVFGIFYYVISDVSTEDLNIESKSGNVMGSTKPVDAPTPQVAGTSVVAEDAPAQVEEVASEELTKTQSPFGSLAAAKMDVQGGVVLAGADESTQSTTPVPDTGDFSMTIAIVSSLALFSFFAYMLFMNPRKYALSRFEKDISEKL